MSRIPNKSGIATEPPGGAGMTQEGTPKSSQETPETAASPTTTDLVTSGGASRKSKKAAELKAAKLEKKNAKKKSIHSDQTRLIQIFQNMQIKSDPTNSFVEDVIIPTAVETRDASTTTEEAPDMEQPDDEGGEAANANKPKHRRRKNRKANNARAYLISGVDPVELKNRCEPATREKKDHDQP